MSGDDTQWLVSTLFIALLVAIVSHACVRRYGKACLITSVVSGFALMTFYVLSARREITPNNVGQLAAWTPMLFLPGFLCGLCVSAFVGVVFLLSRRVKASRAQLR